MGQSYIIIEKNRLDDNNKWLGSSYYRPESKLICNLIIWLAELGTKSKRRKELEEQLKTKANFAKFKELGNEKWNIKVDSLLFENQVLKTKIKHPNYNNFNYPY